MLKFRCQHCGQRIAVGARHLGRLVTCPECGRPTHPLAEQIVSLRDAPPVGAAPAEAPARPARAAAEPEERCANCGDVVGRLQKRNLWQDHLVCTACHARLSGETAAEASARAAAESAEASRAAAARSEVTSDGPAAKAPQRVAARRALDDWAPGDAALPVAGPMLARGAATAGRLVLAGALAVGALARGVRQTGTAGALEAGEVPDPADGTAGPGSGGLPAVIPPRVIPPRDLPAGRPGAMTGLRNMPLPLHTRLLIILAVVCLAGAAVYGTLSLLRDLTGYLTTAALVLLAVAGGYLVLRLSLSAGRRFFPLRAAGRPGGADRDAAE